MNYIRNVLGLLLFLTTLVLIDYSSYDFVEKQNELDRLSKRLGHGYMASQFTSSDYEEFAYDK